MIICYFVLLIVLVIKRTGGKIKKKNWMNLGLWINKLKANIHSHQVTVVDFTTINMPWWLLSSAQNVKNKRLVNLCLSSKEIASMPWVPG